MRRIALVVCCLLLAGAAWADDLGSILGPLADRVTLGTSGPWTSSVANGAFMLQAAEPGVVRFYQMPWQGDRSTGRSVGVRVLPQGGGAGLVFAVGSGAGVPRWIAFTADGAGKLMVRERTADGLRTDFTGDVPNGRQPGGELLQASETGEALDLFANGAKVWTMPAPVDTRLLDAPVGVIAVAPGQFAFRDFAFAGPVVEGGSDDRIPTAGAGAEDDRLPGQKNDKLDLSGLSDRDVDSIGAMLSILFHEYGHFMNSELKLPVTGPEEDVADEFSAMVWIENIRLDPAVARLALGGAKLWLYMAQEAEGKGGSGPPWYDEHAPDMRRFGAYMCDLYGAYPDVFASVMQAIKVPEARQRSCVQQWSRRREAWVSQLRAHRRQGVDPEFPGDLPANTKGGRITVEWQPSKTQTGEALHKGLAQSKAFEQLVEMVNRLYVLPRDTKLVFRDCDTVNCWYNPTDGSVTMCYEMIVFAMQLMQKYEGGTAQPPQAKQPPAQDDPAAFMVGAWHSIQTHGNTRTDSLMVFRPDGTYRMSRRLLMPGLNQVFVGKGRWTAARAEDGRINVTTQPIEWTPRQLCVQRDCAPLPLKADVSTVVVVNHDQLHSATADLTRVQ